MLDPNHRIRERPLKKNTGFRDARSFENPAELMTLASGVRMSNRQVIKTCRPGGETPDVRAIEHLGTLEDLTCVRVGSDDLEIGRVSQREHCVVRSPGRVPPTGTRFHSEVIGDVLDPRFQIGAREDEMIDEGHEMPCLVGVSLGKLEQAIESRFEADQR